MAGENRNAAVDLDFGGGRHRFRLGIGELEELQESTGVGPYHCLQRLISGEWHIQDVRDTLRLGLIGGGARASEALAMTRRYVDDRPDWILNHSLALLIVSAALAGAPEEAPGKGGAPEAETEASSSPTDALPSDDSMERPRRSD